MDEEANLIKSCLPPEASPPEDVDTLFLLYALLMRAKGADVTPADIHDAWSVWMQIEGKSHAALMPFGELDRETQEEDLPYVEAIKRAVNIRKTSSTP
ncbi:hypothetical protein [Streptomyces sp. NPDC029554]|uniref:DUF7701 domain-containing protein n=1 Tax=Streptomyces sp. NPDC029554 TaxID=3155126 RepID=UPI0033F8CA4E